MSTSPQSEYRTRMFARVLGPYLVIVALTTVARASEMRALASQFGESPAWAYVTGAFILLSGLIVVALHPYWRGAAAITVSVLGWMTVAKGVSLLALPQTYVSAVNSAVEPGIWWQASFVLIAVIGAYLTYVGWAPQRPGPRRVHTNTSRGWQQLSGSHVR